MQSVTFESPIGIDFAGTCDLAIWCKLLHDKGWSGARIGRAIAKSEGYVNNLIRVVERASPSVMLRWRAEQSGLLDHVCATDWLVALCMSPHAAQDEELQRRIATRPGGAEPRGATPEPPREPAEPRMAAVPDEPPHERTEPRSEPRVEPPHERTEPRMAAVPRQHDAG